MSGQQIGSAVGFVAGFFLPGGPMVWSAIGGAIGGWISPTQVNGPRIGDGQSQSSAEGMPIPWILGTGPTPIQGQIVQKSPRREVKKTDDGKGSGTEVNTYEAHQDFCILFCESSEHRGSLMKGVLFCLVDGKIVYDTRPEANFGAENAKFLENHIFYDGNESQMPDPTMEALVGVDYAMYYRGVFTMVARNVNLSVYGDRIPVYQVVMVGEGEVVTTEVTALVPPAYGRFANEDWPLVDAEGFYSYSGYRQIASGGTTATFAADSIADVITHFNALGYDGTPSALDNYIGYSASSNNNLNGLSYNRVTAQLDVTDNVAVVLVYQQNNPIEYFDSTDGCAVLPLDAAASGPFYATAEAYVSRIVDGDIPIPPGYLSLNNCIAYGDARLVGTQPLFIQVTRRTAPPTPIAGDPCLLGHPVLLPGSPGFVIDCAGVVTPEPTYAVFGAVSVWVLQLEATENVGSRTIYTKFTLGPVRENPDPGTAGDWTPAYDAAVAAGTMAPGLVYGVDYPVSAPANSVYEATYTTTSLDNQTLSLATAITRICLRSGLTEEDIDVADMDQQLMGYGVLQPYSGTEALGPLLQAFLAYGSEYDGQLHFHKHGADVEVVVDPNDFIEGTDETDENTRDQQIDFPRQLSVIAVDATQNYTARPQVARRTSPNVRAIGEQAIELAVVLPPDYHAQLADIGLKVMWARAQGPRKFSLPFAQSDTYLKLVPGMPFALDGKRWMVDKLRIGDGELQIDAVFDRQSAYTSDVQPTPALPPTPPPSNIGGVTLFAPLNIGVLRDQDDRVGLYLAVAGILEAWGGCLLQWSFDGGSSWTTAIASMTQASTMGYLTAPLPLAPASGDDVTNTLSVSVHGGQLNSITRLQFLNEQNPFVIVSDAETGECELGQFQTAVETEVGKYDLTILGRGGLNSTPAAHPTGVRFVFLDSVYFLEVPTAMIGQTILFRPVTFGTSPESNATYSVLFNPAVSQMEWSPFELGGRITGSAFVASVTPRHRLGTNLMPVASANFTGYHWTLDDGDPAHAQSFDTTEPSAVFELSAFDSPATITVAQNNRITGPGPSVSITI